nr:reverse transcriptase domain-containing protein [Tanacetum cinerariifolium]
MGFLRIAKVCIDLFEGGVQGKGMILAVCKRWKKVNSMGNCSLAGNFASSNPTPYYDPIGSTSSPTLTPFGNSDFLLEEVDAFLALEDDSTSPEFDHFYFDTEEDILLP